jgi:hypothetical protein
MVSSKVVKSTIPFISTAKNITKFSKMTHWWDDTNAVDAGTDADAEISTLYTIHLCDIYS